MKKEYIVPESKLFAINMKENIAISGGAEVSGAAVIKFTYKIDGCKKYYSGFTWAEVHTAGVTFGDYYKELDSYGGEAYYNCFRYVF